MKKDAHFQIKGISQDLAYQLFNPQYAFELKNIRINATDENSLLSLTNEKGNLDMGSVVANKVVTVLGVGKFTDYCILFAHSSSPTSKDYILAMEPDTSIHTLYEGNLGFESTSKIKTVCVYENEEVQKIYWIDGVNPPRVANVAPSTWDDTKRDIQHFQKLDFLPDIQYGEGISVRRTSGGQFPAGVIQYAYTYSDKNLQETNIVDVSQLLYSTDSSKGASADKVCNVAFTIDILQPDERFDYVQLYVIVRTSLNTTPAVYRIANIPIKVTGNKLTYTDNGTNWENYSADLLLGKQLNSFKPKVMATKDSTLFFGNYTLSSGKIKETDTYATDVISALRNNLGVEYYNIASSNDSMFTLLEGSRGVQTFRNGEYYRIGIQFQDAKGTPSNIIYLGDVTTQMSDDPYNPSFKRKVVKTQFGSGSITELKGHFKRARLVMVDRKHLPKRTICQGVLCPTVYRVNDRVNNQPFAMSSWNMRFFNVNTLYDKDSSPSYPRTSSPQWMTDMPIMPNLVLYGGEIINQTNEVRGLVIPSNADLSLISSSITVNTATPKTTYYWLADVGVYRDYQYDASNRKVLIRLGRTTNSSITKETQCEEKLYGAYYSFWLSSAKEWCESRGFNIYTSSGLKEYIIHMISRDMASKGATYPNVIASELCSGWSLTEWETAFAANPSLAGVTMLGTITGASNSAKVTDSIYNTFEDAIEDFGNVPFFFCDHNVLTFHSPDVEANQALIDGNSNIKYRVVGYTQLNQSVFSNYLTIHTGASTSDSQAGVQSVVRNEIGGIYNAPLWRDDETYATYMWHKQSSLGSENEPDSHGVIHGSYDRKIFANIHTCGPSKALVNSEGIYEKLPNTPAGNPDFPSMGTPRVFNSDEVSALTLEAPKNGTCVHSKLIYYGNVNMSHSAGQFKIPRMNAAGTDIIQDSSSITSSDVTLIRYKSTPHVVMPMDFMVRYPTTPDYWYRFAVAPSLPIPGRSSDMPVDGWSNEGISYIDNGQRKTTPIGYAWSTAPHPFSRKFLIPDTINNPNGDMMNNLIYIAELYQDISANDIYGDTSEESLSKHRWIPIGDWVEIDSDASLVGYGDTFIGKWDCLKTYSFSEDDMQSCIDVTSVTVESDINLDSRYDSFREVQDITMINPSNFNLFNPVYNQENNFFQYSYLKDSELLDNFQNQVCWSEVKTLGEELDTWAQINVGNNVDFQGEYGVLHAAGNLGNNLYFFQESAIYKLNYNTRVAISPTDGVPIQLGTNYRVEPPLLIKQHCGTTNQDKLAVTPNSIYFHDSIMGRLFALTPDDKVNDLSTAKGLNSLVKRLGDVSKVSYDSIVKDVYFNFATSSLAFNEDLMEFTSLYDYQSAQFIFDLGGNSFSIKNGNIYKQRAGSYNMFFGEYKPFYIELLANPEPLIDKTFTNVEYTMVSDSNRPFDSFDAIEASTSYQYGSLNLTAKKAAPSDLKRKFRIWKANIPRNSGSLDRMRDTWTKIKLTKATPNTNKYRVNNLNISYIPT